MATRSKHDPATAYLKRFIQGTFVEVNTDYLSDEALDEIAFLLIPYRGRA